MISIIKFQDAENELTLLGYKILSEYKNTRTYMILEDAGGYLYYQTFFQFKRNIINNINFSKVHKSNPYSINNIKLWCRLNNKPFELLSDKYKSNSDNLKWKCLRDNCGEIFESNWANIQSDRGCPFCSGRQVGLSNCLASRNLELAKEWHPTKNGYLTPWDVTCSCNKDVWWLCKKGHEWKANIANRNNGRKCPYCSGKLPSKDYNLLVCNPQLCEEWDYEKNDKNPEEYTPGTNKKVWWKCKECGHEWQATIGSRNIGNGCPICAESKGEKECNKVFYFYNFIKTTQEKYNKLNKYEISNKYYIPQKTFDGLLGVGKGLLSYDFYLPQYNLLIEYQGIQHEKYIPGFHKSKKDFLIQQEHDKRKREYAQNNNINLLEIWYWDFNNIVNILKMELKL